MKKLKVDYTKGPYIPEALWQALYISALEKKELLDKSIVMGDKISFNDLYTYIKKAAKDDEYLKIVRLIVSHTNPQEFEEGASFEGLLEELLYLAISKEDEEIFDKCNQLNPEQTKKILNKNRSYVSAADLGHCNMMDKIENLAPVSNEVKLSAFIYAAANGQLAVITKLLIAKKPDELNKMLQSNKEYVGFKKPYNAFYWAVSNLHQQVVLHLVEVSNQDTDMIIANNYHAFSIFDKNQKSKLTVIKHLLSILGEKKDEHEHFQKALETSVWCAIVGERLDCLIELKEIYPAEMDTCLIDLFKRRCRGFPPKSIAWYFANFPEYCKSILQENNYNQVLNATASMNYKSSDTAHAFLQHLPEEKHSILSLNQYSIIYNAAKENKFAYVAEYLSLLTLKEVDAILQGRGFTLFVEAIKHNSYSLIEPFITPMFVEQFISKHRHLADHLESDPIEVIEKPKPLLLENPQSLKQRLLDHALIGFALCGKNDLVTNLLNASSFSLPVFHEAMIQALEHQKGKLFSYLYSYEEKNKQSLIEYSNYSLFAKACSCEADWLVKKLEKECSADKVVEMINSLTQEALYSLIKKEIENKYSTCSWILHTLIKNTYPEKLKESKVFDSLMKLAISRGNKTFFKKCCQLSEDTTKVWLQKNSGYVVAAEYGHLGMMFDVEKLVTVDEQEKLRAFVGAAEKGQLQIIEHLLPGKIDKMLKSNACGSVLSNNPYNAFYQARNNCHYEVINYLLKLSRADIALIIANDYAAFSVHNNSFFRSIKIPSITKARYSLSGKNKEEFFQALIGKEATLIKHLLATLTEKNEQAHFQKALATTIYSASLMERIDVLEMLKETYPEIMASLSNDLLQERDAIYNTINKNSPVSLNSMEDSNKEPSMERTGSTVDLGENPQEEVTTQAPQRDLPPDSKSEEEVIVVIEKKASINALSENPHEYVSTLTPQRDLVPDLKSKEKPIEVIDNREKHPQNQLTHASVPPSNNKTSNYSFYFECMGALTALGGIGTLLAGVILANPLLIGIGAGLTVLGLAGSLSSYCFFAPSKQSNTANAPSPEILLSPSNLLAL
ncbi:MAG: hypothetical protein WC785_00975 [Tatlockia sp.]|jgi:hypothetical protein